MMTPLTHRGSSLSGYPESAEPWRASISVPFFFLHRDEGVRTNERPVSSEIVRDNQPQEQLPRIRIGEATG